MDLDQVSSWRSLTGKVGAFFCLLASLAVVDGLVANFREPAQVVKVLPGTTKEINGSLAEEVRRQPDLAYESDSEHLRVAFAALHKGYFLGGDMWRGELIVSPQARQGEYRLTVKVRGSTNPKAASVFRVVVYPDAVSLRRSSTSLVRRQFGIPPWGLAGVCVPVILLTFAGVYLLSQKREDLLARAGKGEIYRVKKGDGTWEIKFSLGTTHGVGPGTRLTIFNEQGQPVGTAQVLEASATDSLAQSSADQEIRPGYIVSLPPT